MRLILTGLVALSSPLRYVPPGRMYPAPGVCTFSRSASARPRWGRAFWPAMTPSGVISRAVARPWSFYIFSPRLRLDAEFGASSQPCTRAPKPRGVNIVSCPGDRSINVNRFFRPLQIAMKVLSKTCKLQGRPGCRPADAARRRHRGPKGPTPRRRSNVRRRGHDHSGSWVSSRLSSSGRMRRSFSRPAERLA